MLILDGRANDRGRENEKGRSGEQDSEIVRVSVSCKNNMTERHQQASKAAKKMLVRRKPEKLRHKTAAKMQ